MKPASTLTPGQKQEIDRYLRSGEHHDPLFSAWPGQNVLECAINGGKALRNTLVEEVKARLARVNVPDIQLPPDLAAFTRSRVGPMVRGLFPSKEQEVVLGALDSSIVFVTPANYEQAIRRDADLKTAWDVANFFLSSVGAKTVSGSPTEVVGLSVGTKNYVSICYFTCAEPCADYVVHECAHVFHNTKRRTVGLPFTRTKEWMLEIDFKKRELFAYCCETYRRLLEEGQTLQARRTLVKKLCRTSLPPRSVVDPKEYLSVLEEAVEARNGWKRILKRCGPPGRSAVRPWQLSGPS
ncbi:MAG: hypothetical protein HY815_29510 [Candidatus Riflebacteria bacterium]|nr:hypothetical protein [Candidatus Riflebacteria bacterium]